MNTISNINPALLSGKTVIVRVDYNVPVIAEKVIDDLRIKASFETVKFLKNVGAKIILISHIENKEKPSLDAVARHINSGYSKGVYPFKVTFESSLPARFYEGGEYVHDEIVKQIKNEIDQKLVSGEILLFENLRVVKGEKDNDPRFSQILASLADYYVNDAFSVSHRAHASVVGIPALLPHAAGVQLANEISHLNKGLTPSHPFIFILGGAKFETKLPLIEKFMKSADKVIVGGALFNDILKAKGLNVGNSLVSNVPVDLSKIVNDPKLVIPKNVIVKDDAGTVSTIEIDNIQSNQTVLDIGPDLIDQVKTYLDEVTAINQKPFVLWNGPMGNYEVGFKDQTVALAKLFSDQGIEALLGGGDTTAAIAEISHVNRSVYVSTGGGAMIEFLLNETLPGIDSLN